MSKASEEKAAKLAAETMASQEAPKGVAVNAKGMKFNRRVLIDAQWTEDIEPQQAELIRLHTSKASKKSILLRINNPRADIYYPIGNFGEIFRDNNMIVVKTEGETFDLAPELPQFWEFSFNFEHKQRSLTVAK